MYTEEGNKRHVINFKSRKGVNKMGTRALTVIKDEWENKEIVVMYCQFDGYPSYHGLRLGEFLKPFTITNGISGEPANTANGMGCLSAQIIRHFKEKVGGIYLYPAGTRDVSEEYIYTVLLKEGKLHVICEDTYDKRILFAGTVDEFITFCKEDN
jgi:hypothetical protein